MNAQKILKNELAQIRLSESEMQDILEQTRRIVGSLKEETKKRGIKASVFIGGSLAKGTIIKKGLYDIDIFMRFSRDYEHISDMLEPMAKKTAVKLGRKLQKVHGSRDYFRIIGEDIVFEIIPVIHADKAKDAVNITDLSYFHVSYIRGKISKSSGLDDEIRLAKKFCYAAGCYGAESYIRGFSGYALELLVIHYRGFLKFLRAIAYSRGKIIIDPEHHYKSKEKIMQEMNEAKLQSPIVFVDPTHRERNALAALSEETFLRFKEHCRRFLKNPSRRFFIKKEANLAEMRRMAKKKLGEFIAIEIKTDRQEGDIAGTKLLKFANFLERGYDKYFDILKREFLYGGGNTGLFFIAARKKKSIIIKGPPINSIDNLKKFKRRHAGAYIVNGFAYAKEKSDFSALEFFSMFKRKNRIAMRDMGIVSMKLIKA